MQQISDDDLSLDVYQGMATKSASYPQLGSNMVYPALGLVGEAGEVAEKIKKLWRNKDIMSSHKLTEEDKQAIIKELGDCMWYVAALACELRVNLSLVARQNIDKLRDRLDRGVIKSEGDNR
jgi:NTP pyrophosphatase (non-canonical NTP hydrolase)